MYVKLYTTYDSTYKSWFDNVDIYDIRNIEFNNEADLVGNTLPITEFSVDVRTTTKIKIGAEIELVIGNKEVADLNVFDVQELDNGMKHIIARSKISYLSRRNLKAKFYTNTEVYDVLGDIFGSSRREWWDVDTSIGGGRITGYFPEQTARERLQQLCFAVGTYVRTYHNSLAPVIIEPLDDSEPVEIPEDQVYWKPQVTYKDYVRSVTIRTYSYTEGTPQSGDQYVEAGGHTYIETSQDVTLNNTNVPTYAEDNEVLIANVRIMTADNVSAALARLANYYFNRTEVRADVLNPGLYYSGQYVVLPVGDDTFYEGYVQSASYKFGRFVAKTRLSIAMAESIELKKLTLKYVWGNVTVGKQVFRFAVGATYEIDTIYIDKNLNGHRYIFRPEEDSVTGTMPDSNKTVTVECNPALDHHEGITDIISVDEVTRNEGTVKID